MLIKYRETLSELVEALIVVIEMGMGTGYQNLRPSLETEKASLQSELGSVCSQLRPMWK
jgi:hypothetical protein